MIGGHQDMAAHAVVDGGPREAELADGLAEVPVGMAQQLGQFFGLCPSLRGCECWTSSVLGSAAGRAVGRGTGTGMHPTGQAL